jgi:hypothetical protein
MQRKRESVRMIKPFNPLTERWFRLWLFQDSNNPNSSLIIMEKFAIFGYHTLTNISNKFH